MANTAYQTQYREEFIAGFEQRQSILRDSVTTEVQVKGNQATFLVADSGSASAVTRGVNGRIPGRSDNLSQPTVLLQEWHDKPERTGFNIFASQGDGRRIMQETSMAVINRKIDQDIIEQLATGTQDTGAARPANLKMALHARTILTNNKVPLDGQITAVITGAFEAYLLQVKEFANAEYVTKKPLDTGETGWQDKVPGYYKWLGVRWLVHPELPGVGTAAETCFMFHRNAIGHAAPSQAIMTNVGYNEEHDYSYALTTAYMGSKLLQNSGIVVMNHDGSEFAAT